MNLLTEIPQLCCWRRMQRPLGQTADSRITLSGLLSPSVRFSVMSLVVASYLELLLQYNNSWCDLEPLFALLIFMKNEIFMDSDRMGLYLQIWLESTVKLSENKHNYSYSVSAVIWEISTLFLTNKLIEQNYYYYWPVCKCEICFCYIKIWPYSGERKQMPSASDDHSYYINNIMINSLSVFSLMNNSASCSYNEECSGNSSTEHVFWGVYCNTLGKILPIRFYFSRLSFMSWNLQYLFIWGRRKWNSLGFFSQCTLLCFIYFDSAALWRMIHLKY